MKTKHIKRCFTSMVVFALLLTCLCLNVKAENTIKVYLKETLQQINVEKGNQVDLPKQVVVIQKDDETKTSFSLDVDFEGTVNKDQVGTYQLKAVLKDQQYNFNEDVSLIVNVNESKDDVVDENAISVASDTDTIEVDNESQFEQALQSSSPVQIKLTNDLTLTKTYTISNKTVSISGNHKIILGDKVNKAFVVKDQGDLTINDLTFDLNNRSVCVIDNSAKTTINSGTIKNGAAISNSGLLFCHGNQAKLEINGGSFINNTVPYSFSGVIYVNDNGEVIMNNGKVSSNKVSNQLSGPICVNNAKMTLNDGEISQNSAEDIQSSSGIYILALQSYATSENGKHSEVVMNGGKICDNDGLRGGGVTVQGGASYYSDFFSTAAFTMNGGTICHNTVSKQSNIASAGGGVYIEFGATMTLNDGVIEYNTADSGMGGAVATNDGFVQYFGKKSYSSAEGEYNGQKYKNWYQFFKAGFTMNGGKISNNTAKTHLFAGDNGCGGGIYIASNNVFIKKGIIENNSSDRQGGGIYIGSVPYKLNLYDALVSDNTATLMGGGVWCCPTGTITNAINNGGAVINNKADGAGDDIVTVRNATKSSATVANRILGGGRVEWYQDGAVTSDGILGQVDESVNRFENTETSTLYIPKTADKQSLSIKAIVDQDAVEQAENTALVFIRNNKSLRGGGIGTNGAISIGKSYESPIDVKAKKVFEQYDKEKPTQIKVNLLANDLVIDSMYLNDDNNWEGTFKNLPSQKGITYRVEEEKVNGWFATYTGSINYLGDYDFTITNHPEDDQKSTDTLVHIEGKKYLDGQIPSKEYTFELYDEQDQLLQSVHNKGDKLQFDALMFNTPGTYHYYVLEKKGNDKGIIYDNTRYDVEVIIQDDFTTTVSYSKDNTSVQEMIFNNTTEPTIEETPKEKHENKSVDTGDQQIYMSYVLAFIASLVIFVLTAIYRLKKYNL